MERTLLIIYHLFDISLYAAHLMRGPVSFFLYKSSYGFFSRPFFSVDTHHNLKPTADSGSRYLGEIFSSRWGHRNASSSHKTASNFQDRGSVWPGGRIVQFRGTYADSSCANPFNTHHNRNLTADSDSLGQGEIIGARWDRQDASSSRKRRGSSSRGS
jgi:hypothetical protein